MRRVRCRQEPGREGHHLVRRVPVEEGPGGKRVAPREGISTKSTQLIGDPADERIGVFGMIVRFFLSRFIGAGNSIRPKYEVMGSQDMSGGVYRINNEERGMLWKSNKRFHRIYNAIEDFAMPGS